MVVRPPTSARDNPAALHCSRLSRLYSKNPMPTPRATRVPAMSINSAIVSFFSIMFLFRLTFTDFGVTRRDRACAPPSGLRASIQSCLWSAPLSLLRDGGQRLRDFAQFCAPAEQASPARRLIFLRA